MDIKYLTKYLTKLILLSGGLILGGLIFLKIFNQMIGFNHLIFLVSLFFIVNTIFHYFLILSSKEKSAIFIRVFMITTIIKILIYISILIIYILILKFGLKTFLLNFLITYFSFTIFEVFELSKILKNTSSK
jgi:hypothetical protein